MNWKISFNLVSALIISFMVFTPFFILASDLKQKEPHWRSATSWQDTKEEDEISRWKKNEAERQKIENSRIDRMVEERSKQARLLKEEKRADEAQKRAVILQLAGWTAVAVVILFLSWVCWSGWKNREEIAEYHRLHDQGPGCTPSDDQGVADWTNSI